MNLINPKDDPHAPDSSWWVEATTREEFNRRQAERDIHMRLSRAAKSINPLSLASLKPR